MVEPDAKLNPAALPLANVARLLRATLGSRITVNMLEVDRPAGARVNADGGSRQAWLRSIGAYLRGRLDLVQFAPAS